MSRVSVLIMSRWRPASLERMLVSLTRSERIEILVRIDADDDNANAYRVVCDAHGAALYVEQRPLTLGEGFNSLAARCTGDVLIALPDDYEIVQDDWAERLMAAAETLGPAGFISPRDPTHPGFTSMIAVPRKTYEALGYIIAPHFPFWFGDTWWDELREMTGLWTEADFDLTADARGSVTGIADLDFWARVFEATRPERVRDAGKLLAMAFIDPVLDLCRAKVAHLRSPELIATWEARQASPPSARYLEHRTAMAEKYEVKL